MRIVSLLPSATEIVAELGLLSSLVGRSEECDWPLAVARLPVVSGSKVPLTGLSGREIDEAVKATVEDGESLYALDADRIALLRPDMIVTQDLCRVCAVSSDEVCDVGAEVISLDPHTLAEIAESVRELGRRLGAHERGDEIAARMTERIDAVRARVAGLSTRRVFVAEWLDPPFAPGHWLPEMVAAAGGLAVLGRPGEPSHETSWAEVAAEEPELVVLAPCGFDATRAAAAASSLELPWPTVAVDANAFFSRPSPRVAEGVEILGRILHPAAFAAAA
jgi:iron complex transport system substrate-binding protein